MNRISNRGILIWLSSLYIGSRSIGNIMEQVPQLTDLWNLPTKSIYSLKGINAKTKERIIANRRIDKIEEVFNHIEASNTDVTTIFDRDYPKMLKHIYDSPKVLYRKGQILEEDSLSIAIVGSRKATNYGKWATERLVNELVNLDVTIVSGLATGIDGIAHRKALKENGRTIGVLGNGLDIIYPRNNRDIYRDIPGNGAIVTEFCFGVSPLAYNFPQRNRIISGLSLGVIVVEAKEKSGSLITAHHAMEQGREVFALPGNINSIFSRGTNKLIGDGAKLVMDIDDVIEEIYDLQMQAAKCKKIDAENIELSEPEMQVFKLIEEGPIHCDSIVFNTGMDISTVYSILTALEMKGLIKELTGNTFTLV
ncbi:MAG: DNA-protecting protein DprA [Tissierellia bacterium]|nr:DNA-protecting protein DprA [Tissierellia bacterium]